MMKLHFTMACVLFFACSISQNEAKLFDLVFLFSCKCIFINKYREKSDQKKVGLKMLNEFMTPFDGLLDIVIVARLG